MKIIPGGILSIPGKAYNLSSQIKNLLNIYGTSIRRKDTIATLKRTEHHNKTQTFNDFNKPFSGTDFFHKNFQPYGNKATGSDRATRSLLNMTMVGTYPHSTIHYPNILIAKGFLPGAENATAALNNDGNIVFSWSDNSGTKNAKPNDKVILVAYFPAIKKIIYTLHAATRAGCQALLQINKMQGNAAETWIAFSSNDGKDAGNGVYAGRVHL